MNTYSFTVSLRISHPMWGDNDISKALNLRPKTAWSVGSPKTDGAGIAIEGLRDHTYWCYSFGEPQRDDLTSFLEKCIAQLAVHSEFFDKVAASGGETELFIGIFADRNIGVIIPLRVIAQLDDVHCGLAFDIYPPAHDKRQP